MTSLLQFILHGFLFALSKSAVLLAPLLAATVLHKNLYGNIEWWLALSIPLGQIIGVGAPGVVAYGSVGGKLQHHVPTATAFVLSITLVLVILALAFWVLPTRWSNISSGLICVQIALSCLQATLSARLKGLGKGAWASTSESAIYLALLGALLVTTIGIDLLNAYFVFLLILYFVLATALTHFTPLPSVAQWHRLPYLNFLQFGTGFVAGGTLMTGVMTAPRILLGVFGNAVAVADYSLAFRWLSIAIVLHQFVNTLLFRRMFGEDESNKREILQIGVVSLVMLGALGVVGTISVAHSYHLTLPLPHENQLILPMTIGMILWSTTACLEGNLYRASATASQTIAVCAGAVTFIFSALAGISTEADLTISMAYAWVIALTAIILAQYFALRSHEKSHFLLVISGLSMSGLTALLLIAAG